jgi:hypothetical protein
VCVAADGDRRRRTHGLPRSEITARRDRRHASSRYGPRVAST